MNQPASKGPLRLVVVDDHPIVREGTAGIFRREAGIQVVGAAADGAACLQLVREAHPDVLLLDLHLPDMSGMEVVRRLRADAPEVQIVVLTGFDYLPYRGRLRGMGVERILSKAAPQAEIVAAVRAAGAREPIPPSTGPMGAPEALDPLTPRECEVLEMLAQGKQNAEVAQAFCISVKTVEFHVSNILTKLGARSRMDAVLKAQRRGLLDAGPPGVWGAKPPS